MVARRRIRPPAPAIGPAATDGCILLAVLDAADIALALFDVTGRITKATPALVRLLAADPEGDAVWRATHALATGRRHPTPVRQRSATERSATERQIDTTAHSYRVVVSSFVAAAESGTSVLVERRTTRRDVDGSCAAAAREMPAGGLTVRERQVAGLLAQGRTAAQVASVLGISVHTARHHVERVYQKLGVRSRAALGSRLAHIPGRPART